MSTSEVREWLIAMDDALKNQDWDYENNHAEAATIFRVPISVMEVSEQSYNPKLFSFGLFGHQRSLRRTNDSSLDTHRKAFARLFMIVTSKSWPQICDDLVTRRLKDLVILYDGYQMDSSGNRSDGAGQGLDPESISILLTLDAIFVVCFIHAQHQRVCSNCKSKISILSEMTRKETSYYLVEQVLLDIIKFENQIPLLLIQDTFNLLTKAPRPELPQSRLRVQSLLDFGDGCRLQSGNNFAHTFMRTVYSVYWDLLRHSEDRRELSVVYGIRNKHLLECVYSMLCYKHPQIPGNRSNGGVGDLAHKCLLAMLGILRASLSSPCMRWCPWLTPIIELLNKWEAMLEGHHPRKRLPKVLEGRLDVERLPKVLEGRLGVERLREVLEGYQEVEGLREVLTRQRHAIGHSRRIPTATKLYEAGIRVTMGNEESPGWISVVKFEPRKVFRGQQAVLYLPGISVHAGTETLLRNLLAYEYVVEERRDLLSYIHLMDNLIDTKEDVKLMVDSGVLQNNLGDEKLVAEMWNKMLNGVVVSLSGEYEYMYSQISKHCQKKKNILYAEFWHLYMSRPWLPLGVFVALITVIATIVSTVYAVLSYYDGSKQRVQT